MGTETCAGFCRAKLCDGNVEKMGPLRGDGNVIRVSSREISVVEKMGPLRGDGTPGYCAVAYLRLPCREETPFEGTETNSNTNISIYYKRVEKMGPPRGDGNLKYGARI